MVKTKIYSSSKNYGYKRSTSNIDWIVIHYTGNDGDTAKNNGNYFKNNVVKASAHYFVDSNEVVQSVPDNYVAWSVGGSKYNNDGGKYYGKCTNANSLSIELCDDSKNGKVYPTEKTIKNALNLTKELMKKYGIDKNHVIRHYDVTGKSCPAYWCGTTEKDKKWKNEFWNKISSESSVKKTESSSSKKGYSGTFPVLPEKGYLGKGDKGTQVKRMQAFLVWYGYSIEKDGSFGTATKQAVEKFQKGNGLKVDGFFGSATLKKAKSVKK